MSFDTYLMDLPVCPHCGYQEQCVTDINESGLYDCGECEKEYHVEVEYSVTYTTTKPREKDS